MRECEEDLGNDVCDSCSHRRLNGPRSNQHAQKVLLMDCCGLWRWNCKAPSKATTGSIVIHLIKTEI